MTRRFAIPIATTALSFSIAFQETAGTASAATTFFETFDDFHIEDANPVSWTPVGAGGLSASTGDLVLSPTGTGMGAVVEGIQAKDISIRTQFRAANSAFLDAGLFARGRGTFGVDDVYYYAAGITGAENNSSQSFLVIDGFFPSFNRLIDVPTDLDAARQDVVLQFDVTGDRLRLTAWAADQPKPASPQIDIINTRIAEPGGIGVYIDNQATTTGATFRYFQAVPEPSTALLLLPALGLWWAGRRWFWGKM